MTSKTTTTNEARRQVSVDELRKTFTDGRELALLDVREEGSFEGGHLFWANNLPLSQLELLIGARIPRRGTRIILVGDADGLADVAAVRLDELGYTDVSFLEGGQAAWVSAGLPLYKGLNVPSKAFGEFVEHAYGTPHIEATELKALQDSGADLVVLDSRPLPEYVTRSIPGGIDCPGAELSYRVHDAVRSPETLIVVNCAGRTRSIIGAQSLINAGVPNRVVALKDGTMGWHLAGLTAATGAGDVALAPSPEGLAKAKASADRLRARFDVRRIDDAGLAHLRAESESRALFVFDVRQPDEYLAGHRPGVRNAPGGQLVQQIDSYAGIRNARIVLTDDTGVRATVTGAWLVQIGWPEVYVLSGGLGSERLETGPEPRAVVGLDRPVGYIDAADLQLKLGQPGTLVIDLQDSESYRRGRVPGAWFAIRSRLARQLPLFPDFRELVITSPDGVLAALAAADIASSTNDKPVHVLRGGTASWRAAGFALETGDGHLVDKPDDLWVKPFNRRADGEKAMADYLEWETALVAQIRSDKDVSFRVYPALA
ncbi:rhodanese homology domain-containing protein [soil metagenome]